MCCRADPRHREVSPPLPPPTHASGNCRHKLSSDCYQTFYTIQVMREMLLLSYHNIISSLVCSIMTMITIVFFVGMTVEEAYFSGAMITVRLMYSRNRKSTLITSRYLRSFINVAIEPSIHWCSVFRWRTNAVSAMTRPDASSSPAMQLTR